MRNRMALLVPYAALLALMAACSTSYVQTPTASPAVPTFGSGAEISDLFSLVY